MNNKEELSLYIKSVGEMLVRQADNIACDVDDERLSTIIITINAMTIGEMPHTDIKKTYI